MSSLLFFVAYVLIAVQENIKDVIAHIMLNYEDRIQELSETRFCGQCFKGFIRRYEMNIHPPPLEVEEKPPPQYVFPPLISSDIPGNIFSPSSQPMEMRRVDVDEESYFNGDDGDDEDDSATPGPHPAPTSPLPPLLTPPLSRFQFGQKRRRQRAPGIPLRTSLGGVTQQQRAPTPATPIHLPRTPPINALVEYGESLPPPLVLPVAAADLCRCVRRSVDVQRRMRMRWAWSGSLAVNRNVRPRVGQLEVVRKAQNVSGYDLVQPAWRRRLLRHPLRHAQGQALRTGTRVREGHPLIDDNCYS